MYLQKYYHIIDYLIAYFIPQHDFDVQDIFNQCILFRYSDGEKNRHHPAIMGPEHIRGAMETLCLCLQSTALPGAGEAAI